MTAKVFTAFLSAANNLNDILSAKQITLFLSSPCPFSFARKLSSPIMRIINLTGSLPRDPRPLPSSPVPRFPGSVVPALFGPWPMVSG